MESPYGLGSKSLIPYKKSEEPEEKTAETTEQKLQNVTESEFKEKEKEAESPKSPKLTKSITSLSLKKSSSSTVLKREGSEVHINPLKTPEYQEKCNKFCNNIMVEWKLLKDYERNVNELETRKERLKDDKKKEKEFTPRMVQDQKKIEELKEETKNPPDIHLKDKTSGEISIEFKKKGIFDKKSKDGGTLKIILEKIEGFYNHGITKFYSGGESQSLFSILDYIDGTELGKEVISSDSNVKNNFISLHYDLSEHELIKNEVNDMVELLAVLTEKINEINFYIFCNEIKIRAIVQSYTLKEALESQSNLNNLSEFLNKYNRENLYGLFSNQTPDYWKYQGISGQVGKCKELLSTTIIEFVPAALQFLLSLQKISSTQADEFRKKLDVALPQIKYKDWQTVREIILKIFSYLEEFKDVSEMFNLCKVLRTKIEDYAVFAFLPEGSKFEAFNDSYTAKGILPELHKDLENLNSLFNEKNQIISKEKINENLNRLRKISIYKTFLCAITDAVVSQTLKIFGSKISEDKANEIKQSLKETIPEDEKARGKFTEWNKAKDITLKFFNALSVRLES